MLAIRVAEAVGCKVRDRSLRLLGGFGGSGFWALVSELRLSGLLSLGSKEGGFRA